MQKISEKTYIVFCLKLHELIAYAPIHHNTKIQNIYHHNIKYF